MAWDLESEVSDLAIGICNLRSGFRSLESERLPEQRLQHKLSWRAQPVLHKHSARDDHCLWSYQFRGGKLCSVEVFFLQQVPSQLLSGGPYRKLVSAWTLHTRPSCQFTHLLQHFTMQHCRRGKYVIVHRTSVQAGRAALQSSQRCGWRRRWPSLTRCLRCRCLARCLRRCLARLSSPRRGWRRRWPLRTRCSRCRCLRRCLRCCLRLTTVGLLVRVSGAA